MLRKLNFTERARIPRSCVRIDLRRESDGVLAFDAALDLASVRAPKESRVFLEAQYRTSYMRFDCGSLVAPLIPMDRRLDAIESDRIVRFRVKVVDDSAGARRIVAASNDITVTCDAGGTGTRLPLLPVNFDDLGDEIWRIHFEAGQPVLELNNGIDGIERMARQDPRFFALVYPAAVREVLTHFLLVERWDENEEGSDAPELWLRWGRELTGDVVPEDPDDREAWIRDVVTAFCGRHQTAEKMRSDEEEH